MGTTVAQDKQFAEELGSRAWLEIAIEWIGKNMEPEDVFSKPVLAGWAEAEGYERE